MAEGLLRHWHEIAYALLALLFIAAYVVHFIPALKETAFARLLHTETIVMLILIFVAVIAARVERTAKTMEESEALLRRMMPNQNLAQVHKLSDLDAFYAGLNDALRHAEREVHSSIGFEMTVEQVAQRNPEAAAWVKNVVAWTEEKPGRAFYRIVSVNSEAARRWFEEQCALAAKSESYTIRALDEPQGAPRMTIVIFDRKQAFLAMTPGSGLMQATVGYRIDDPGLCEFILAHYARLWDQATRCPSGPKK